MAESDIFPLRSGVLVSRRAVELAIDLELRGVRFSVDDGQLEAGPADRLTAEDCAAIQAAKWHLLAIVAESVEA